MCGLAAHRISRRLRVGFCDSRASRRLPPSASAISWERGRPARILSLPALPPRQCLRRGLRLSQLKWPSPTACPRMPQAAPQVEPFWIGLIEGFLGARASRPHNDWHALGHLLRLDRPAAAPRLSFGLAVAVTANVVAACKAARKLSDHHKEQDAGGTPALPGDACAIHSWFTHKPQTWFTRLVFVKWG